MSISSILLYLAMMLHIHIVWLYLNLNGWYSRWYLFIVTCLKVKHFYFACTYKIHFLKRPWNWTLYKSKVRAVSFYYTLQSVYLRFFLFVYFLLLVESEFSDLSSSHDHKESKDHFRPFREGSLQFFVLNVNLPPLFFLLSYNRSFECDVEHSFPLCKWFPNSPVAWS